VSVFTKVGSANKVEFAVGVFGRTAFYSQGFFCTFRAKYCITFYHTSLRVNPELIVLALASLAFEFHNLATVLGSGVEGFRFGLESNGIGKV
jgi:hypothetical protein